MELICLSSLNNDVSSNEHTRYNATSHRLDDHKSVSIKQTRARNNENAICLQTEISFITKRVINIKKKKKQTNILQQNSLIQLFISKETEAEFLKYRIEYYNLFKCSPMYSDNTRNKPWNIVAW